MRVGWLLCCVIGFWIGCSAPAPRSDPAPGGGRSIVRTNSANVTVAPATTVTGKVVHVNPRGQFAVVTFPLGYLPRPEKRLAVYRNGLKVGELKVSKEQIVPNAVADIMAGEAQVGDEVRDN